MRLVLDSPYDKVSFSEKLPSVALKYTLPELKETKKPDYVTVKFQNISCVVKVYGNLDGSSGRVRKTSLDKLRFLPVMDTLMSEKQVSSSSYRDVLMLWRMVKDELVFPLLTDLCDKAGLESPPCLMLLPTELKRKILESLCGVSIGSMACVCKEMRNLTSDNDLWKQKYVEEALDQNNVEEALERYRTLTSEVVNWKNKYAEFWRNKRRSVLVVIKRKLSHRQFSIFSDHFSRPQRNVFWFWSLRSRGL